MLYHLDVTVASTSVCRNNDFAATCYPTTVLSTENRPAIAEVLCLIPCVFRVSEVDQVEVDALNVGSAQVGTPEVSLADFFGGFDVLGVIVIGVETGTAPLAGDRTAHEAAARRAKVEARAPQVGIVQISTWPIDLRQARASQIGTDEIGILHPRAGQ